MAEFNLIQNPELLRRLARLLGMRQGHVLPTLNEGVQAVVIMGEARDEPTTQIRTFMASGFASFDGVGINPMAMALRNPLNSGILARVIRWWVGWDIGGANDQIKLDVLTDAALSVVNETIAGRAIRNGLAAAPNTSRLFVEFGAGPAGDHMWTRNVPSGVVRESESYEDQGWDFFIEPGRRLLVGMDSAPAGAGYGGFAWQERALDPGYFLASERLSVS